MSWNRPSGAPQPQPKKSASPSLKRGLLAGLVVVLGAGLAAWLLTNGEADSRPLQKKDRGLIREVTPTAAPKVEPEKREPVIEIKKLPDGRLMKYKDGKKMWMFPRKPPTKVVYTNSSAKVASCMEERVFKNPTDVQIAVLLNTEPGTAMVGDAEDYYRDFERQFKKAMQEPILDDPEDTEETRLLKQDVRAVREDLERRMKKGEDITEIMCAAFKEVQELGLYRQELAAEVNRLARDGDFNERDANDLVGAANKMLEERGAKPITMPGILRHRARLHMLKESQNNNQGTEQ